MGILQMGLLKVVQTNLGAEELWWNFPHCTVLTLLICFLALQLVSDGYVGASCEEIFFQVYIRS